VTSLSESLFSLGRDDDKQQPENMCTIDYLITLISPVFYFKINLVLGKAILRLSILYAVIKLLPR
jgi:hypothetical protein